MRMIQKGQVRYIGKDIVKQNQFVRCLFGLAAQLKLSDNGFLREIIFLQQCYKENPNDQGGAFQIA